MYTYMYKNRLCTFIAGLLSLLLRCNIKVLRKSITQISDQGRLDNERRLFVLVYNRKPDTVLSCKL